MAELLIHDVSQELATELARRASERGLTASEEARQILQKALGVAAAPVTPGKYTLRDHIFKLAEIAPDIDFERRRTHSRRQIEF